jgi:hypothetical protein
LSCPGFRDPLIALAFFVAPLISCPRVDLHPQCFLCNSKKSGSVVHHCFDGCVDARDYNCCKKNMIQQNVRLPEIRASVRVHLTYSTLGDKLTIIDYLQYNIEVPTADCRHLCTGTCTVPHCVERKIGASSTLLMTRRPSIYLTTYWREGSLNSRQRPSTLASGGRNLALRLFSVTGPICVSL